MTAFLNKRRCPAQEQLCKAITACPRKAIRYEVDDEEPLGGKIIIDVEQCDNCGVCVTACCGQAIIIH